VIQQKSITFFFVTLGLFVLYKYLSIFLSLG